MATTVDEVDDDSVPKGVSVSVILVTYNHERFIRQALESVLAQRTSEPFELIISEDCSTDGTGAIVEAAAAADPDRIRLVRSPANLNSNLVSIRAIDMARGEYLAFLDGDDYWTSPQKLEAQAAFLDSHPQCSMCFHDVRVIDDEGSEKHASFRRTVPTPAFGGYADLAVSNFVPGPAPMIRKAAVAAMPTWFEGAPYGDLPLYLEASKHGSVGAMDAIMGVYREHSRGLWSGANDDRRTAETLAFLRFLESVEPAEYHAALRQGAAQIAAELVMRQLRARRVFAATSSLGASLLRGPAHAGAVLFRTMAEISKSLARRRHAAG